MRSLPTSLARCFPEYRLENLDPDRDAELIILRTLEHGGRDELRWLFGRYGVPRIRAVIRERGVRALSRRAFTFWRTVLEIRDWQQPSWLRDRADVWPY